MVQGLKMQYDNEIDQGRDDSALIGDLRQEYEWINGSHRPEEPVQWLVHRAKLAKRYPHMPVAV